MKKQTTYTIFTPRGYCEFPTKKKMLKAWNKISGLWKYKCFIEKFHQTKSWRKRVSKFLKDTE